MKDVGKSTNALFVLVVFLLSLCWTTLAFAQEVQDVDFTAAESAKAKGNVVGLGIGFAPDYEGSDDYQVVPLIQARFTFASGRYIGFLGSTLRANLLPNKVWNAGVMARYRSERDDVDNNRVDRMEKVDAALELGAFLSYNLPNWVFQVSVAQDVADAHDGYLIDFGAGYRQMLNQKALITIFASGTYASDDYMETYFGVTNNDSARSGLRVYNADGGFKNFSLGGLLQYNFTEHWGVLAVVQYSRLLGDASDSPLVDDVGSENQLVTALAVNYRW